MANNYTQFSEMLCGLTPIQARWLERLLDEAMDAAHNGRDYVFQDRRTLLRYIETEGSYEGGTFDYLFKKNGKKFDVWFYSEESGNVDLLAEILHAFFKKFDLPYVFGLTWADWCDKRRIGAFSGGYMVVTRDSIVIESAYSLLERERVKHEASELL